MNKKILIGLGSVLVLAAVVGMVMSNNQGSMDESSNMDSSSAQDDSMNMDSNTSSMSEEEMQQMVDEGGTVMVMGGKMSPTVIYASPGQEVKIANHENIDLSLMSEDGSVNSEVVVAGENGSFVAPSKPGTYTYYSSADPNVAGTLVVEE